MSGSGIFTPSLMRQMQNYGAIPMNIGQPWTDPNALRAPERLQGWGPESNPLGAPLWGPLGAPSGGPAPQYPGLPSGVPAPSPYGWTPGQRPYVDTSRFAGMPQGVTQRQAFTPMSNGMNAYLRGQQRASDRAARQAMNPSGRKGAY